MYTVLRPDFRRVGPLDGRERCAAPPGELPIAPAVSGYPVRFTDTCHGCRHLAKDTQETQENHVYYCSHDGVQLGWSDGLLVSNPKPTRRGVWDWRCYETSRR